MTPEERIAQLEAEVRSLRLIAEGQATALRDAAARLAQEGEAAKRLADQREAARLKKRRQRAEREAAFALSRDSGVGVSPGRSRDDAGTPPSPPLPPPFPSPSLSAPISPPPISSPNPSSPPSFSLSASEPFAGVPAKKPKAKKEPTGDPRHAPLVKALTDAGWPFDGGKDARNVSQLLAYADQQETTRGELAGLEVLRRARIAWDQFPGFHSARTLSGLRSKWGEFAQPDTGRGTGPPDVRRGSVRAELFDHTKQEEPF